MQLLQRKAKARSEPGKQAKARCGPRLRACSPADRRGGRQRFQFLGAFQNCPSRFLQALDLLSKLFFSFAEFLLEVTEKLVVLTFGKREVVIS
jgi:hypothetical protein